MQCNHNSIELPTDCVITIGPVTDGGEGPFVLERRDGKWVLAVSSCGHVVREVSDEEIKTMRIDW